MDSEIDSNDENPFHEIIEPEKNESKPKESKRSIKRREQREARKLKMKEGIFLCFIFVTLFSVMIVNVGTVLGVKKKEKNPYMLPEKAC